MSETVEIGAVLAVSGGFMDAYSYLCRNHVFANAQTGNVLLLGVSLSAGDWSSAVRYSIPILAFSIGIVLAEVIRRFLAKNEARCLLHWRQLVLLLEMLFLAGVSLVPQSMNLLANSIISLACGMQVESFRKIHGNGIATTMCIGNLRSGTENLCEFFQSHEKNFLHRALLYYGIILCFVLGAVFGNFAIALFKERAILVCAGVLLLAFVRMFWEKKRELGSA